MAKPLRLSASLTANLSLSAELFELIDTNGNGRVSRFELRNFVSDAAAGSASSTSRAAAVLTDLLKRLEIVEPIAEIEGGGPAALVRLSSCVDTDESVGAGLSRDEFAFGLTLQLYMRALLTRVGSSGANSEMMRDEGFAFCCEKLFRARCGYDDEAAIDQWDFDIDELWVMTSSTTGSLKSDMLTREEYFQLHPFGQLLNFIFTLEGCEGGEMDSHDREFIKSFFRVSNNTLAMHNMVHQNSATDSEVDPFSQPKPADDDLDTAAVTSAGGGTPAAASKEEAVQARPRQPPALARQASDPSPLAMPHAIAAAAMPVLRSNTAPARLLSSSVARLRIVHVNDVYELDELPRLASLIAQVKAEAKLSGATVIATLGGDFLAPSVLSGLDNGFGMVDCMNRVPFDYVCFGNHEADVPLPQLIKRVKESNFGWVNTNMESFDAHSPMPRFAEVTATSPDGTNVRHIALLGLLLADPSIWKEGALGGCAASITPIETSAREWYSKLKSGSLLSKHIDLVVPLTHQLVAQDEALARCDIGFPLILGAHDHQEYVGSVTPARDGVKNSCTWIKTGADAHRAAIVDIAWGVGDTKPDINFKVVTVKNYVANEALAACAFNHQAAVRALDAAVFLPLGTGSLTLGGDPAAVPGDERYVGGPASDTLLPRLTSKGHRQYQSTMGTLVCTAVRDVVQADVCLIDSGCIRGNAEYGPNAAPDSCINFTAVKNELPFPTTIVVVELPGSVIAAAIAYSRTVGFGTGGFLQCDRGVYIDNSDGEHVVTHLSRFNRDHPDDHLPRSHDRLDEDCGSDKMYRVAILLLCLKGMNNNKPIKDWVAVDPTNRIPANDSGRPGKPIFLAWLCRRIWRAMPAFEVMDTGLDGFLDERDVRAALAAKVGDLGDAIEIVLNALILSATPNYVIGGDSGISEEMYNRARNQPSGEQSGRPLITRLHARCATNNGTASASGTVLRE